jgi:hypothetical protein
LLAPALPASQLIGDFSMTASQQNPIVDELGKLDADLVPMLEEIDSARRLASLLPEKYKPVQVVEHPGQRVWELAGLYFFNSGRLHEALGIFWSLYLHTLEAQAELGRVHKGVPLVWMSECFRLLNFPIHAKRYLMLTLCEDALRDNGIISPQDGVYFRWVWIYGLPGDDLSRYASELCHLAQQEPALAQFPEALLQRVDDGWLTEFPSAAEALSYRINPYYTRHLIEKLGDGTGETLEALAEYLMSCMPGCRTRRRERTGSGDHDVVCAMEGFEVDFRSELGRHFVCECKDWASVADFTTMAKFCRVLDSIKSRFGILFSKSGISGTGETRFAEREQLKVFHDREIVIVVLDLSDLQKVAKGANLITLLRNRYETVRLDLKAERRGS